MPDFPPLLLGCLAALGASLLMNAGQALQALEAREAPEHEGLRMSLLRRLIARPRWLVGQAIGYLAFPLQLAALAHAPLVVVQPMHGAGLLVLLALGAWALREKVRPAHALGVLAIAFGLALLAFGAPPGRDAEAAPDALMTVTIVLAACSVAPFVWRDRLGSGPALMICAGLGFASANFAARGLSGALGGGDWPVILLWLAAAGVSGWTGTLVQMTAFTRLRAIQVVPVTFAIPTFLPVVLAPVLFTQDWAGAALGGLPFALGAAVLCAGTVLVARTDAVTSLAAPAARPDAVAVG